MKLLTPKNNEIWLNSFYKRFWSDSIGEFMLSDSPGQKANNLNFYGSCIIWGYKLLNKRDNKRDNK